MKKFYSLSILALSFFAICNSTMLAQNKAKGEILEEDAVPEKEYKGNDIFKAIFVDAGYGANKLAFGLGVRYWNLGASFGIAGLGSSMPSYFKYREGGNINQETAINIKKYPSINITTDLYYFYDFTESVTAFVNLGYGVGSDSLLANHKDEQNTTYKDRLYPVGTETKSGVTFGLGVQYFLEKWVGFGVGYHSRRGVYAQFNYFWY